MSEVDNLKKAVQDVQRAVNNEVSRVADVITTLRANPSAGDIQDAADTLEAIAANLNAVEAAPTIEAATTGDQSVSA